MEFLVLLAIFALLALGPRRGGGRPSPVAMVVGVALLAWFIVAYVFGWIWRALIGEVPQP
ncbi:MAG: hypothetical protein IT177_12370 [Acidobacteria bacterium]|nr:hypothetical protein [Acidobacteriota bacterium]